MDTKDRTETVPKSYIANYLTRAMRTDTGTYEDER